VTKSSAPPKSAKPANFEAALTELEKIVASMESAQMPLEASLAAYKRGAELLHFCQTALQDAAQQVRMLEADTLKPFSVSPNTHPADATDPDDSFV